MQALGLRHDGRMYSHIFVGVGDFDRALAFYSPVMAALGRVAIPSGSPAAVLDRQAVRRPGLRPEYHAHDYGAYFRDPDGNKLAVACHQVKDNPGL
jgi:catechol 2,3-dioxygenase-like lactoylglutathione lyase family enzyme